MRTPLLALCLVIGVLPATLSAEEPAAPAGNGAVPPETAATAPEDSAPDYEATPPEPLLPPAAGSGLRLSGWLRSDLGGMLKGGTGQWAGQVEERLEVAARAAAFRAYADLRARQAFSVNDGTTLESWHLPRAFVRLSDETLQLTVGRAWIGLGPAGPLNPFELAPSLEMTDLAAERAGFPIIAAQLALGTLSGAKFYAASLSGGAAAGTEWFTHLAGFDGGLVLGRAGRDRNLAGCWLKGDLGIGLDLALALHFPDDFSTPGASLTAGIDYSLGGVVLRVAFHHDSRGGAEPYNYEETPSGWFHGRLYLQGGLAYQVDEFFALALDAFANLDDASLVLIPAVRWTVVDGLTAEGYPVIPLGHGEFGRDRLGDAGLALRLTAKF